VRVVQVGNGQALLQVNSQQVLAQTRMPLFVGQTLRLQGDQTGTQPQLRVLDGYATTSNGNSGGRGAVLQILNQSVAHAKPTQASATVPVASSEVLAAAVLRNSLPQRQSLPYSMLALEQFVAARRPKHSHPSLDQARAMAADLLQGLPRPEDAADPHRLRAMVQRSGLFHEAELAQHSKAKGQPGAEPLHTANQQHLRSPPAADMKARLMAVAESLATAMRRLTIAVS
jgi:hypothetical protein